MGTHPLVLKARKEYDEEIHRLKVCPECHNLMTHNNDSDGEYWFCKPCLVLVMENGNEEVQRVEAELVVCPNCGGQLDPPYFNSCGKCFLIIRPRPYREVPRLGEEM